MRLSHLLLLSVLMSGVPASAADMACIAAGFPDGGCREPLQGAWETWRFVVDDKAGPVRNSEAAAVSDAVSYLSGSFPCGLTYAPSEMLSYAPSGNQWSWPNREDAALSYVGFVAQSGNACGGTLNERNGKLAIRRERKILCPRDFNWLVRDDQPGICIRD